MSFETIERLKREYTDKYVVVDPNTPELRRFSGLTGQIKTVNMNGRALVQFDSPVDISWYDIDLSYLTVVDQPLPKKAAAEKQAEPVEKKPAPAKAAGKSPLELARAQGAAKATSASAGEKPLSKLEQARRQGAANQAAAAGEKPVSKLEQARAQGAAKAATAAAPAASDNGHATSPSPAAPATGKPHSKLELARQQGAAKGAEAPAPVAVAAEVGAAEPASAPAPAAAVPTTGPGGKPLSKLELARLQGPYKGNK